MRQDKTYLHTEKSHAFYETESALLEHTKREVFQAGHVCDQSLIREPALPSPK